MVVVAMAAFFAFADTVTCENVLYTISNAAKRPVEVFVGTGVDGSPAIETSTEFTLEIPGTFTVGGVEYKVTGIGAYAFKNCANLSAVTLPDSISKIDSYAFYGCRKLESVNIPSSVKSMGDQVFRECSSLKSVTIPGSISKVGNRAFAYCSALEDVVFEDGVETLYGYAFGYCGNLKSIVMPPSLTWIRAYAFVDCGSLNRVEIAANASFEAGVFGRDRAIREISIPQSVVDSGMTNIFYDSAQSIASVTLSENVTNITATTFAGLPNLKKLTILGQVESIAPETFAECKTLEDVTIPASVTNLTHETFSGCSALWAKIYSVKPDVSYDLSGEVADRAIASVTVDGDCSLDVFVLKDGKVYDTVLRVENVAGSDVTLSLPAGYRYETFAGTRPLAIPANSVNLITITRTQAGTFLVSRRKLQSL